MSIRLVFVHLFILDGFPSYFRSAEFSRRCRHPLRPRHLPSREARILQLYGACASCGVGVPFRDLWARVSPCRERRKLACRRKLRSQRLPHRRREYEAEWGGVSRATVSFSSPIPAREKLISSAQACFTVDLFLLRSARMIQSDVSRRLAAGECPYTRAQMMRTTVTCVSLFGLATAVRPQCV